MADAMRGACSMTPVVTNVGVGNSADVDVLHDDIKATLGGKMTVDATTKYFNTAVEATDAGPKWFYCPDMIATTTPVVLGYGYSKSGGIWNGNDTTMTTTVASRYTTYDVWANTMSPTDHCRMIYLENTGLDKTGATTTNCLVISASKDSTPISASSYGTMILEAGESMILKFAWDTMLDGATVVATIAQDTQNFYLQAIGIDGVTAATPDNVCYKVVALCEDGV